MCTSVGACPSCARDSDFWICSSIVICLRNLRNPSRTGLLRSFVLVDFNLIPNWICLSKALCTFAFSDSKTNWPLTFVIVSDFKIGFDRSLHSTWRNFFPDSTSFIISDQSGRLLGRALSFSKVSLPFSDIDFFSKSFGASNPGLKWTEHDKKCLVLYKSWNVSYGGGGGGTIFGGGGGGGIDAEKMSKTISYSNIHRFNFFYLFKGINLFEILKKHSKIDKLELLFCKINSHFEWWEYTSRDSSTSYVL